MRSKALVVALLCIIGLTAIFIGNALAEQVFLCSIDAVGANYANKYIYMTDTGGAFTARVFLIDPNLGNANEMLAVFLTAWSNSQKVGVMVSSPNELSTIYGVNTRK
jgi:hypothetical protein